MREKQFDVERQDQNPFPGYSMKPNGHSSSTPEPVSYLDGYPRVAAFMSLGNDLAVFRKFDRISLRSLLFQQSQLLDLENEIDQLDAQEKELDRKSTRLNSSHDQISYAVFCLKK